MRIGMGDEREPAVVGTLSHLCASVAEESASPTPSTRWRSSGERRPRARRRRRRGARRPPPSRAPRSRASHPPRPCSPRRPARRPSPGRRRWQAPPPAASGRIRPWSSTGTDTVDAVPSPRRRSARSTVTWRFPPTSTRTAAHRSARCVRHPSRHARAPRAERRRGRSHGPSDNRSRRRRTSPEGARRAPSATLPRPPRRRPPPGRTERPAF